MASGMYSAYSAIYGILSNQLLDLLSTAHETMLYRVAMPCRISKSHKKGADLCH